MVFIHYGPSSYLRHTLVAARRTNPDKTIYLLGDRENRACAAEVAHFVPYDRHAGGRSLREFDEVFQAIQGKRHRFGKHGGTETWLKFVFRRWFIIADFLAKEGIDSFWTFDSDTLIFGSLGRRESRFRGHQATAQCRDCCLNGWIGSRALVEDYVATMTALFRDTDFLDAQRKRVDEHVGLAFNEMDAFCEFRRRRNVRTFHAAQPLDGEFFDDALAYDANFEASPFKVAGRIKVKRLWSGPHGALYAKHLPTGGFVRMVTGNLSWLPDYAWKKLMPFCLAPARDAEVRPPVESELREVDLSQPLSDKIVTALHVKFFEMRRALGR